MYKKLIYFFSFLFFIIGLFYFYKYFFISQNISYDAYSKEKDFIYVNQLMERNKFWLFHGDAELGKIAINKNIDTQLHEDDFEKNMQVPYFVRVARLNNKTVGFISYFGSNEKKIGRIHLLVVDAEIRRSGIAKSLLLYVLDFFKKKNYEKIFLYTRPENIRAKKLYKKFNFYEVDQDSNIDYFLDKNPGDILVLELL